MQQSPVLSHKSWFPFTVALNVVFSLFFGAHNAPLWWCILVILNRVSAIAVFSLESYSHKKVFPPWNVIELNAAFIGSAEVPDVLEADALCRLGRGTIQLFSKPSLVFSDRATVQQHQQQP